MHDITLTSNENQRLVFSVDHVHWTNCVDAAVKSVCGGVAYSKSNKREHYSNVLFLSPINYSKQSINGRYNSRFMLINLRKQLEQVRKLSQTTFKVYKTSDKIVDFIKHRFRNSILVFISHDFISRLIKYESKLDKKHDFIRFRSS